jgi:hypothetical protein
MRRLNFSSALIFFFILTSISYGETSSFHWLDPKKDPNQFSEIEKKFSGELSPDKAGREFPYIPIKFKEIHRIGIFQNFVFVIIKNGPQDSEEKAFYNFYNYNLENKKKMTIQIQGEIWDFEFYKLARFEDTPIPDIVFSYWDCRDCEAVNYLSSLQFDSKLQAWKVRKWNEKESILIGSNDQIGEYTYSYDCIHKIQDMNGDGYEDVGTWCKLTSKGFFDENKGPDQHLTFVYSVVQGLGVARKIDAEPELSRIHEILCRSSKSPLCKKR